MWDLPVGEGAKRTRVGEAWLMRSPQRIPVNGAGLLVAWWLGDPMLDGRSPQEGGRATDHRSLITDHRPPSELDPLLPEIHALHQPNAQQVGDKRGSPI